MHSFEVNSNESVCQKKFRLGLEQVINQVNLSTTYARLWAFTAFVEYYSNYSYARLIRGTSDEETI